MGRAEMDIRKNVHALSWLDYTLLGLVTLLAAILRGYNVGDWSYFVDEVQTLVDTPVFMERPWQTLFYSDYRQAFWLLTQLSFDLFGVNAFSLRFFPCLFGMVTIPLLYFPCKALFDKRVALLASGMMAVSHWHIYMSQMARWYSLLLIISFFSLLSLYLYIERNAIKYLLFYIFLFLWRLHFT